MEVLIKNFNCIQSVKLDFKPGFNVIQGPSNSGKSSIIKAIEKCIFNQSGSTNVRQGQDNLLVGIKYRDREVYLTKGKNTKYKVDDQIYEKIGVNQLEQVAEALNIREVVLGGEKVRLNFSNQFSYPFLLDKSPGQLYKFIVDSAESESLSDVLKDMSKDIKDLDKSVIQNEAQIDILTKQKNDIEAKLSNSEKILEVSNKVLEMDSEYTQINREVELKDRYLKSSNDVEVLRLRIKNLSIDKHLQDRVDNLYSLYTKSVSTVQNYTTCLDNISRLSHKIDSCKNFSTGRLDLIKGEYERLVEIFSKYSTCTNKVVELKASIKDYDNQLEELREQLGKFKVCPLCGSERMC